MSVRIATFVFLFSCVGCNSPVAPPKAPVKPQQAPPAPIPFEVESVDGGFKIAFPSKPVRSASTTKNGKPSENYVLQTVANVLVIGFSYPPIPLPQELINEKVIAGGLDGAVENYVRESKGELVSKHILFRGDVQGKEFRSKIIGTQPGDRADVKGQVFWHDGRLIRMVAIGQNHWLESKEVDDFFASFSVLQPK